MNDNYPIHTGAHFLTFRKTLLSMAARNCMKKMWWVLKNSETCWECRCIKCKFPSISCWQIHVHCAVKTLIYKKMMLSIETTFLLVEKNLDYTFHSGFYSTADLPQNACCIRQFSTNCTFHILLCPFISLKEAIYLLCSSFVPSQNSGAAATKICFCGMAVL